MAIKDIESGIVPKKTTEKAVATVKKNNIQKKETSNELNIQKLIELAMKSENGVEIIKELTALQNQQEDRAIKEEERQAKIKFMDDFSEMQKEFAPVQKTKKNKQHNSKYASISDLQNQYGNIISKHGFSYDFGDPEFKENGSVICKFNLMKYGYTRTTPIVMPPYEPAKGKDSGMSIMNPMQAVGTQISYGNRYAMKAGLGVTEEDEDADGNIKFEDATKYHEDLQLIESAQSPEQLNSLANEIHKKLKTAGDNYGLSVIKRVYTKKKIDLQGGK